jgi:EF-P beta-lysylation protein EpmB
MIQRTVPTWQIQSWQEELKDLIQDPRSLIEQLSLGQEWLQPAINASTHFPLRATKSYISRIQPGDPADPLLLQILPLGVELEEHEEFTADPLEEKEFTPIPGLVHKYRNRVLLIAATQCAINCRYCFRRHFPYGDHQLSRKEWMPTLDYIRNTPEINEVILSGGDPLSLSDKQLAWLTEEFAAIPHIKRLRIHSRYPIILPSRLTHECIAAIRHPRLKTVMVMHCNHPQEIDDAVREGVSHLIEANILVLNQAVLLKNINDKSTILATLSETLFDAGVMPYYLHLLDKVAGAAHFLVNDDTAKGIYSELLTLLPGYLVPKLVRELPHEGSKTPIAPAEKKVVR